MALSIAERIHLLEKITLKGSGFWTDELNLGKSTWRQWRAGRSSAIRQYELKIAEVLRGLGYDTPDDLFTADYPDPISFQHSIKLRTALAEAHMRLDFKLQPGLVPQDSRFSEYLRSLQRFARSPHSERAAIIVSPNPATGRALLNAWLLDETCKPLGTILHIDVRRHKDAASLVAHILQSLDPNAAELASSPLEQVSHVAKIIAADAVVLIIEHLDEYADGELLPDGKEFRIGMAHILIEKMLGQCFLHPDPPDSKAKVVITAAKPMHVLLGRMSVINLSTRLVSTGEEHELNKVSEAAGATTKPKIAEIVNILNGISDQPVRLRELLVPTSGSAFNPVSGDTLRIQALLASLPLPMRVLLRLIASSVDGLRTDTLTSLLKRLDGGIYTDLLKHLDTTLAACTALLAWVDDDASGSPMKLFRVNNRALRLCILSEWEESDVEAARSVYREVGFLALEASGIYGAGNLQSSSRTLQNTPFPTDASERLVQAAQCLLASVSPTDKRSPVFMHGGDRLKRSSVSGVLTQLSRSRKPTMHDTVQFVYREVWQHLLEDGRFQMIRGRGLIEAKMSLLLSFFRLGTLVPVDIRQLPFESPLTSALSNEQGMELLIALAIATGRAGLNNIALAIARHAQIHGVSDNRLQQKRFYKILIDALIRGGEIKEALSYLEEIEKIMIGRQLDSFESLRQEIQNLDPKERRFRHICGIDFLSRRVDALMLLGRASEAIKAAELMMEWSRWESIPAHEPHHVRHSRYGGNGRRYMDFLLALACRKLRSPIAVFGEAQQFLNDCHSVAVSQQWENEVANLAIYRARLRRLVQQGFQLRREELLHQLEKADAATAGFSGSTTLVLEALAERARVHSYFMASAELRDGKGALSMNVDDRREGLRYAKRLLDASQQYSLPVFEAEALLLHCELRDDSHEEHLEKHDQLCDRLGLRHFEHPRSLIVHGQNASLLGAW